MTLSLRSTNYSIIQLRRAGITHNSTIICRLNNRVYTQRAPDNRQSPWYIITIEIAGIYYIIIDTPEIFNHNCSSSVPRNLKKKRLNRFSAMWYIFVYHKVLQEPLQNEH